MKKYSAVSAVIAVAMLSVSGFALQGTAAQPQQNKTATHGRKLRQKLLQKPRRRIQTFVGVISDGQCAVEGVAQGDHEEGQGEYRRELRKGMRQKIRVCLV